jgi:hypothetical protein
MRNSVAKRTRHNGIVPESDDLVGAASQPGFAREWYGACVRQAVEIQSMNDPSSKLALPGTRPPQGIWNRLRGSGILREADLIRIYRIAQQHGIAPEEAALALGVVTEKQLSQA